MKACRMLFVFAVVMLGIVPGAEAARGGMRGMGGGRAAAQFAELFGKHINFSATADMSMKGRRGMESMEMKYAMLDGQLRVDFDMSKLKSEGMTPDTVARMKQMGMDRTTTIVRPGKATVMIYPELKGYVDIQPRRAASGGKPPKIEKTRIGTETVDGHPCIKYKIIATSPNGRTSEMTTWEATDLQGFPIKNQITRQRGTVTMTFKDIDLSKPAASLFETPTGYKHYASVRDLVMSHMGGFMHGMMGGQGGR